MKSNNLAKMIGKRVVQSCITILLVTLFVFALIQMVPGDPVANYLGATATEEQIAYYRHLYGFDRPVIVQYLSWIGGLFRGTMGQSISYQSEIADIILPRLGTTLTMVIPAFIIGTITGILFGIIAAKNRGKTIDSVISFFANIGVSMPMFWLGMMGILLFATKLHLLPTQGMYNLRAGNTGLAHVGDVLVHMILPCSSLIAIQIPSYFRITKTSVMQVMADDYIMTFRVTGMSEKKIFRKYILKNAILPVLTVFGINLAYVVSGSTLTEIVFSWPGIGSMMYRAIMMRDYNVLMGIYLILALSVAAMMIVVDLVYAWLDPRIRYT